jgi:hypothetical protein
MEDLMTKGELISQASVTTTTQSSARGRTTNKDKLLEEFKDT